MSTLLKCIRSLFFAPLQYGVWGEGRRRRPAAPNVQTAFVVILALLMAFTTCACATNAPVYYGEANTCDASEFEPGHPECLPLPGFFCVDAPAESAAGDDAVGRNATYVAQVPSLFPSKESLGPTQPICPPNSTRLVQEQDWKEAKKGAKQIGYRVAYVFSVCERIVGDLGKQPDNILAGENTIQPEELEAKFLQCASELNTLPAIPEYEDTWLAGAAREGFKEGYGQGAFDVWLRLFLLDVAIATLESAIMPATALVEVAVTRGIRASMNFARRMPIFIPGAVGSGGAFLKGLPGVVKTAVTGSSRVLARNMIKFAAKIRLPGEFAHHIAAHGDPRALKSVEILERFGLKVDDAVNGVFLPGYETSPNPLGKVVHGNLHTNAYHDAVLHRLQKAEKVGTRSAVEQALREIAYDLEHGIVPK